MNDEKERQSGEELRVLDNNGRSEASEPMLPTVNPAVTAEKKAEPAKGGIHPAFYIAYVQQSTMRTKVVLML